ncbi:plasmid mobilization protein [Thioalkalivibrio denitrificans]|uniref:plasmid mobilization protein n=1 Tax=Thioalkalivibrio denitrificans TaxID=108003 RepID=UPI0026B7DBF3
MHRRNQRIVIRVTHAEHTRLARYATHAGLSLSEFIRRTALDCPNGDEEQARYALFDAVVHATARAERAIDDTLEHVARSNERIKRMEARARHRGS